MTLVLSLFLRGFLVSFDFLDGIDVYYPLLVFIRMFPGFLFYDPSVLEMPPNALHQEV